MSCASSYHQSYCISGFNRKYPMVVKEEDAVSDSDSTEDKPGAGRASRPFFIMKTLKIIIAVGYLTTDRLIESLFLRIKLG